GGGGGSLGVYESLNLGLHVGDNGDLVAHNRERVKHLLRPKARCLCLVNQVHGIKTVIADPGNFPSDADALVTQETGVAVAVMTADCAPVLIYDPVQRIVGVAHAGWRGALNGIVESCIDLMETLGGDARRMSAIVGPTIRPPNYEVDEQFFLTFKQHPYHDSKLIVERFFLSLAIRGRFQFNLTNYIIERLHERGIPQEGIKDVGLCTFQNEDLFFSYRRSTGRGEKSCGRQMGGIILV
ncbi:MAG TPA: peptidoglycan editing factor PgeF, partial [Magnetococcales bacterium]|nr:peptidoglycan editing factor PgeF [Magnetococcales bacterium]